MHFSDFLLSSCEHWGQRSPKFVQAIHNSNIHTHKHALYIPVVVHLHNAVQVDPIVLVSRFAVGSTVEHWTGLCWELKKEN